MRLSKTLPITPSTIALISCESAIALQRSMDCPEGPLALGSARTQIRLVWIIWPFQGLSITSKMLWRWAELRGRPFRLGAVRNQRTAFTIDVRPENSGEE